jgi:hypothetical protein
LAFCSLRFPPAFSPCVTKDTKKLIKGVDSPEQHHSLWHSAASASLQSLLPVRKDTKRLEIKGVDSPEQHYSLWHSAASVSLQPLPCEKGYKKVRKKGVDSRE